MKTLATLVLLLTILAALPSTEAAAPAGAVVDRETNTVQQSAAGSNHISERIEFRVTVTSQYRGNWSFQIQPGHQNLQTFAERNGEEQMVNASVVSDGDGHDVVYVNLSAIYDVIQTSDRFAIRFEYEVGPTYDRYVTSEPGQLVVYAEPMQGQMPNGENIPDFVNIGTRYHAGLENPSDGHHYTVEFTPLQAAPGRQETRDLTPYLYGLVGLAAGFLVALFLARRGLVAQKAKKFEKGGAVESREMLEARRRTLMAALKELELAHEAKDIPDAAYAPLKEEYKAQAVKVMRTLDEKRET